MTDLNRTAGLFSDLNNLANAGDEAVAFSADMGGEHAPGLPERTQNRGKLVGRAVAFWNVHDAARNTGGAGIQSVFNKPGRLLQFRL